MSKMKMLVVVSSCEKYPNMTRATGLWLGEAVHFVDSITKAGYQVDFVSPRGGYTPLDPLSIGEYALPVDWDYYHDRQFMNRLGATVKPSDVSPEDYCAIYFAGGHGAVWDFPDDITLQGVTRGIYESRGIVSAVCHGLAGLLNVRLSDGRYLIEAKEVTGFSNEEETLAQVRDHTPYLIEDELKKRGARYTKAAQPFAAHVVADGRLVTGQNPQSARGVAEKVLEVLRHNGS